jgi:uncharacterized protein
MAIAVKWRHNVASLSMSRPLLRLLSSGQRRQIFYKVDMMLKQKMMLVLLLTAQVVLYPTLTHAQKTTPPAPAAAAPASSKAAPNAQDYDPTKQSPLPPSAAETTTTANRTLLWEVKSKKGNTVYLFGTIHVGKSSFYPLPASVDNAFKQSAKLVVEANIMDQKDGAEIARLIELPKGETVAKHISPQLLARLKTQLSANKIPYDNVANMRPVMLGGMLPIVEFIKLGYEMNQGLDFKLLERAIAEKKPIKELETALGQIKLLTGMSPIMQEAFLDNAVTSLEQGKGALQVGNIVNAWQKGDPKLLAQFADEASRDGKMTDALNETLLAGRHPAMLEKIEGYLASEDTHFIAVGSLHLVGRGGLIEMLKALGYSVAQL